MSRLLLAVWLFLCPVLLWAATITSSTTGSWGTGATWVGGVAPGNGDTAVVAHNITVDDARIIGTSPVMGNIVLTVNTGVTLTISGTGSLTMRGDGILNGSAILDMSAGSAFYFDASQAATPSTTEYRFHIGSAHGSTPFVKTHGTSGSRVTISSIKTNSAANGSFTDGTGPWLQAGNFQADFTTFTNIGDSNTPAFMTSVGAGQSVWFRDCIFDTCGKLTSTYNINATANFDMQRCVWKNSVDQCFAIPNAGYTSGTRLLHQNVFDEDSQFFSPAGWTVTENYFDSFFQTTAADFVSFSGNFVRMTNALAGSVMYGPVTNNFFLYDEPTGTNVHFIQAQSTMTISGNIFEFTGTDGVGDCITFGNPASAATLTINNNIFLPNAGGDDSGTPFSALGNANLTFSFDHNTFFSGQQGAAIGETYAGRSGMCTSMRSNIAYDTSARGYFVQDSGVNDAVSDYVTSANLNYNTAYNTLSGSNGNGVNNLEFSSGSPGANNVNQNPQFFDSSRDAAAYNAAQGGAGTIAALRTEMKKRNDTGHNAAYTPPLLIAWVKDGFRPGNVALRNAGHDGVTIGAQDYFAAGFKGGVGLLGAGR